MSGRCGTRTDASRQAGRQTDRPREADTEAAPADRQAEATNETETRRREHSHTVAPLYIGLKRFFVGILKEKLTNLKNCLLLRLRFSNHFHVSYDLLVGYLVIYHIQVYHYTQPRRKPQPVFHNQLERRDDGAPRPRRGRRRGSRRERRTPCLASGSCALRRGTSRSRS